MPRGPRAVRRTAEPGTGNTVFSLHPRPRSVPPQIWLSELVSVPDSARGQSSGRRLRQQFASAQFHRPLRLVGVCLQIRIHLLANCQRSSQCFRLSAILQVREVTDKIHMVPAHRQPPPLKRSRFIGKTRYISDGISAFAHVVSAIFCRQQVYTDTSFLQEQTAHYYLTYNILHLRTIYPQAKH